MEAPVVTVILSGGSGSRLWPLSRDLYPKQLISLTNNNSLLQNAVLRAKATVPETKPIIICNEEHRFLVAEQLREINVAASAIVLEPIGRNTAAAIAVSALEAIALYGESAIILVKPSDHVIRDTPTFGAAVNKAVELAKKGELVTFGIVPNRPDTAFGYIDASEPIEGQTDGKALRVKRFVEKPNLETAQKFLKEGTFFWNSGMFVFPARRFLTDLQRFEPEILNACVTATSNSKRDLDFTRLDAPSFSLSPSKSVDYAVMERVEKVAVVPLNAGWDDVGSWDALWLLADHDGTGTVRIGDVVDHDTSNSYIRAEHRLVATVGMDNVVIIETPDAVLVASKSRVQDVKKIVDKLKEQGRHEHIAHTRVFRPWGSTESIAKGPRYEVKRLIIKPGGSQSRQMHFHRTEHWVVVKGTAKVTTDEGSYLVTENESTYISVGKIHRLENPGKVDLEVIEIRSGSYMGEDDIVRVDEQPDTTIKSKTK